MNENIKHILEAALLAPSGENTQPWRFVVSGNNIKLFNRPEQDQSLYNWGQRASYMANGAAIENISIAATHYGYKAEISLFPEENLDLVANIHLIDSGATEDELYPYISARKTNRKPYKNVPITTNEVEHLLQVSINPAIRFNLTQDHEKKETLGHAGSTNEVVMLSNKMLHNFFFSHINWNKQEDDKKKVGFYIKTLELAPPARVIFPIIRYWPIMNLFNKIGMYKQVGKQNGSSNAQASGFGAIMVTNIQPKTFVLVGRGLERIWLTATKLGISMQPLTGTLFFMQRVWANDVDKFNQEQLAMIKQAYQNISETFLVRPEEKVVFMFRFGRGAEPSAQASRFSIDELVKIKQ